MNQIATQEQREEAAQLLAQAELGVKEIADRIGVTRQTVYLWRKDPEFLALIQQHRDEIHAAIRDRSIAHLEYRVGELQDLFDRAKRLMLARQDDPKMAEVPGGKTGLLVRQLKKIGAGANAETVEEYVADTALMKEMRAIMEQAAKELGQWVEKSESKHQHSGGITQNMTFDLSGFTTDELLRIERAFRPAGGPGRANATGRN